MIITNLEQLAEAQEKRLVLYGGSFNPPHISHVLFSVMLHCLMPQARILVVPTWRHAFDKTLLPFEWRLRMLHAVLDGFPNIEISAIERELQQPKSYTVNVVKALQRKWPDHRICVAVGADIVPTLPQWYCIDELMSLADFVVFPRQGFKAEALALAPLPQISSTDIRLALQRRGPKDIVFLRTYLPTKVLELYDAFTAS